MKYHIPKGPPTIIPNAVTPSYFVKVNEARTPTDYQGEIVSPKKMLFSAPHSHAFTGNDKKSDNWNVATEQELLGYDLLGDDGPDDNLGRSPVHEVHVTFSVEGLGTTGTETPVPSPKGLGRCKWSEPIKCSPSSSQKFSFCQPTDHRNSLDSPVYSKMRFGPTAWDSSPYSAAEGTPPQGESDLPDLSGQGSVSEDENKPVLQTAKCARFEPGKEVCIHNDDHFSEDSKAVKALIPKSKDSKSKEVKDGTPAQLNLKTTISLEHTEGTSSSVKIPEKSKNHADDNGYNHDAKAPHPCQIGYAGPELIQVQKMQSLKEEKFQLTDSDSVNVSKPVMMLES